MKKQKILLIQQLLGIAILGFLAGCILSKTLWDAFHAPKTLLDPLVQTIQVVEAKEDTQSYTDRFFNIIRTHESSNGTNKNPIALHNYCKNKGKWNEIGYSPKTKFCFADEEEARLYVAYYVKKNCSEKTLASCLCYWNLGKDVETCAYSNGDLGRAN
jgi:5'-3' exonuclease